MKSKRFGILLLTLAMLVMLSPAAFATEGDETGGEGTEPAKAVRTVLLYMCGSDLETKAGMATHNLKQILGSKFSSDEDVNFVVMTGGAWRWQLDNDKNPENPNDYLVFPDSVSVPDDAVLYPDPADAKKVKQAENEKGSISGVYNQIWEARGVDANDEYVKEDADHGKLVLLDGDGLTGEGTAVKGENELMSDPATLKAFINYGVQNYPAEKYDLILWDHAGGPSGGFAVDEHFDSEAEGAKLEDSQMFTSEVVDALRDNDLTSPKDGREPQKFDFIDFDACLQSSVELSLVMADFTDTYIASAEFEPGYGQSYTGWLNLIGAEPDKNAYEVGKQIVDDFYEFYQNGDGQGQEGTLAVINLKKLMERNFVEYLTEMTEILEAQAAEGLYYDEFNSALNSIHYGQSMNYYDLGNFAAMLSVVNSEIAQDDLDKDKLETDNVYSDEDITNKICGILQNKKTIYAKGTNGILTQGKLFRRTDGDLEIGPLTTSGMYIYFAPPDAVDKTVYLFHYKDELGKVMANMPENDSRRQFLEKYIKMLADYTLIAATSRAVDWLINEDKVPRDEIDYDKVKANWTEPGGDWKLYVANLFRMLQDKKPDEEPDPDEARAWLDKIAKQEVAEALSLENVSVKKTKTQDGTGYKVNIKNTKARAISGVQREIGIDYVAAEEAIKNNIEGEDQQGMVRRAMRYNAGMVEGRITDDDIDMESASAEEIIRWYNRNETDWEMDAPEPSWYAVKDAEGNLHAAAINEEDPNAYYVGAEILMANDEKVPMLLKFSKGEDALHLTELLFNTADGLRPIKVSDLTSTYEVSLSMIVEVSEIWGKPIVFLPTSETTFQLNADNAKNVTLEYTDIQKLIDNHDVGDTDGDGEVYHSRFIVKDIYGNYENITERVNEATETVVGIELADVKPAAYTGKKQSPKLVYDGETLKEGEDYTWEFYRIPETDMIDADNYRLRFKGLGKYTGYAVRVFKITPIDISHYAVTTATSTVYTGKVIKPAVKVSGLASSVYKVTYKNNKKVGKATVLIQANNSNYTGSITKTFTIKPAKAGQPKVKVGKKKMTVTAKAKVSKTGGTFYQVRYKVKGKAKWKTVKTKKQKVTIKKLKKGKRYQVQIRAFSKTGGKTYYGAWSKVRTTKKIR